MRFSSPEPFGKDDANGLTFRPPRPLARKACQLFLCFGPYLCANLSRGFNERHTFTLLGLAFNHRMLLRILLASPLGSPLPPSLSSLLGTLEARAPKETEKEVLVSFLLSFVLSTFCPKSKWK